MGNTANPPDFGSVNDWFADAPAGDQPLDQLFPDPNGDGQPSPQAAPPAPQPPAETFFLKTPSGTVYKTADDAVNGITHKDQLIEDLRSYAIERTGFDPVTKKQVRQQEPPASQPASDPNRPVNYSSSPKKFWDDLVKAAKDGDADSYMRIQAQLVNEQLAPYAPLIANVARQSAIDQVTNAFPEFRKFYGTDAYRKTLETLPRLNEAIQVAETNPQAASQLEDFYKMAFLASQGLRLTEAPQGQPPVVAQPQVQPRPTLTSGQIPPPNQSPTAAPTLQTSDGRKAIIQDQISKGVLDLKF